MGLKSVFGKARKAATEYVSPDAAQAQATHQKNAISHSMAYMDEKEGLLSADDPSNWFRDIDEADLLLEHLFEIAEGNEWFDIDEEDEDLQLLTVRSSDNVYVSRPEGEDKTTLEHIARGLNCDGCMILVTEATRTLIDSSPPIATSVVLDGKINKLVDNLLPFPSYDVMQRSGICFVREIGGAVLWNDEALDLIDYVTSWEKKINQLVFNEKDKLISQSVYGDAKEVKVEEYELQDDEEQRLENGELTGSNAPEDRPTMLMWPATVGLTFVVMGLMVGTIVRSVITEVMQSADYMHLLYLLYIPLVVMLTAFFMNQIVCAALQLLGPIAQMHRNSKYYSHTKPTTTIRRKDLPHVTIKCPVYKEKLWDVIDPTVQSCRAAIATYEAQGGTANLMICDDGGQLRSPEQRKIWEEYWRVNNVSWTARRPHGKDGFQRTGLFKKASNLNHGVQLGLDIENRYKEIRTSEGNLEDYEEARRQILEERGNVDWCAGDLGMGDIVLIIDCDTRVPVDCILNAVLEMRDSPDLAIIQHIGDALLLGNDYWELGMAFFIRRVFFGIRYNVAGGDLCPFLGHNAFLRWSAIEEVARTRTDGSLEWWSEDHVSEDFEVALRCQVAGYSTRMATYHRDEFEEGVSLTVYDEIARWTKYAWGCSELMFNPFRLWFKKGPFGEVIKAFVWSPRVPLAAKMSSLFYMWTYWLIGASWVYCIVSYFLFGWFRTSLDRAFIDQFNIIIATSVIFGLRDLIVVPFAQWRLRETTIKAAFGDSLRHFWLPILFFQGVSMHVSRALVQHLFDRKMSWGSTAKSLEARALLEEAPAIFKKYRIVYTATSFFLAIILILRFAVPDAYKINSIVAIVPLAWMCAFHILNPFMLNAQSYISELLGFLG
ncbi:hypothetical protein PYCC9005_004090 [Savitreella phatthalungensis]